MMTNILLYYSNNRWAFKTAKLNKKNKYNINLSYSDKLKILSELFIIIKMS